MLKKNLQFSFAYLCIFILQLLSASDSHTSKLVLQDFYYVLKPSITISLMLYIISNTQLKGRFSKRIFGGLLFGLLGDCFLMFVHINPNFFIYGLIFFLIGHILYITAFYLDYKWAPDIEKKASWLALIVFGIFCIAFYLYLRPYLQSLKIPVLVYAFVISLMAVMAVNRKGRVNTLSFNLIFYGAILFLISDSILAYDRFISSFSLSDVTIMSTYMTAQYLITMGAVERKLKKHSVIEIESKVK
jgi:uncharacterized membrane protein YhhN